MFDVALVTRKDQHTNNRYSPRKKPLFTGTLKSERRPSSFKILSFRTKGPRFAPPFLLSPTQTHSSVLGWQAHAAMSGFCGFKFRLGPLTH